MKNYIRDVIDRYIKHDYPEEVNQDFRTWLTDEERADEKEHELNKLWEATEAVTTPGYRDSLERMHELTGIGSRRRIYSLRTRLVVWRVAAALLITVSSISIYLALGLSSLSSNRMNVESLFIDEGFGSLDMDTLRIAMDALERLQMQGRKIGVISHVAEMTERIPAQVQVVKTGSGRSKVQVMGQI